MTIIKSGSLKKRSEVVGFVCPKCNCGFIANNKEFKRYTKYIYLEDGWHEITNQALLAIKCPDCKHDFVIEEEKAIKKVDDEYSGAY